MVIAGTASVKANLVSNRRDDRGNSHLASRGHDSPFKGHLFHIHLLWKTPYPNYITTQSRHRLPKTVIEQLAHERPLMTQYIVSDLSARNLVENVASRLEEAKKFSIGDQLVWLSGQYLDGSNNSHSPFG